MAETTEISWTDHTFNPWLGCQKVSPGCDNCYAEVLTLRYGWTQWGPQAERRRTAPANWRQPLRWQRQARQAQTRHRVFCASLADVFDNQAPPGALQDLWELVRNTPDLDWQILTKRPQNIEDNLPEDWQDGYLNVWLGISAEDQEEYDRRWPILAALPAVVRFISYEPALGQLTLDNHPEKPDWLIWGGESGPAARPLDPAWIDRIVQDCAQFSVASFGKQWGNYRNNPLVRDRNYSIAAAQEMDPPSNGKGGAKLADRILREFPTPRPTRNHPTADR